MPLSVIVSACCIVHSCFAFFFRSHITHSTPSVSPPSLHHSHGTRCISFEIFVYPRCLPRLFFHVVRWYYHSIEEGLSPSHLVYFNHPTRVLLMHHLGALQPPLPPQIKPLPPTSALLVSRTVFSPMDLLPPCVCTTSSFLPPLTDGHLLLHFARTLVSMFFILDPESVSMTRGATHSRSSYTELHNVYILSLARVLPRPRFAAALVACPYFPSSLSRVTYLHVPYPRFHSSDEQNPRFARLPTACYSY